MAIYARPNAQLPVISAEKANQFILKSNKTKLSKEYLANCQKTSLLFKKKYNEKQA